MCFDGSSYDITSPMSEESPDLRGLDMRQLNCTEAAKRFLHEKPVDGTVNHFVSVVSNHLPNLNYELDAVEDPETGEIILTFYAFSGGNLDKFELLRVVKRLFRPYREQFRSKKVPFRATTGYRH